jgi:hypothetical protein
MIQARIDAATYCLSDAQIHLKEYLLQRIIGATDQISARDAIYLTARIEKIQRSISATLKDIHSLSEN